VRTLVAAVGALLIPALTSTSLAAVVFNDNFTGGSTINSANATPTSSSTSYQIASTKNQVPNPTAGTIPATGLNFGMAATTSGLTQAQARFANAPFALATAGDYVEVSYTFRNENNLLAAGTGSYVYVGLYNSGGAGPVANGALAQAGLTATAGSGFATGNAAGWSGFVGRIAPTGGTSQISVRAPQTGAGTASANQDLVGNNAGGGTYNNPTGASFGGTTSALGALTVGNLYTARIRVTLNGTGGAVFLLDLFDGTGTGGTSLASYTATRNTPETTSFDSLALGYRSAGTSLATAITVTNVTVDTNLPVPEPATLTAVAGVALLGLRRRRA
jgi:hypothetical protein